MENNHGERIAKLETITLNHEKLLNAQLEKNETLIRLTTLMEENSKRDEQRDLRLESFDETLKNVNANLTNLNKSQEKIQQDISTISGRVEKVERIQEEEQEKNKIDMGNLPKKATLWILGLGVTILTGVITYYAYVTFGVK